jgi:hypothetical protein
MRPLRVLSIDFDYFVDATIGERAELFPDANDNLPAELGAYIWATHYAEESINPHKRPLKDIDVRREELSQLMECICDWGHDIGWIAICESHKHILGYIETLLGKYGNWHAIQLLHIDHHTDCYDIGNELNCGNWLNCLDRLIIRYGGGMKVTWVGNVDSDNDTTGAIKHRIIDRCGKWDMLKDTKDFFSGEAPDFIFLCKSSPWTPPHLDDYFDSIAKLLIDCHGASCTNFIDGAVPANRWSEMFRQVVDQTTQQYLQVRADIACEKMTGSFEGLKLDEDALERALK